MALLTVLRDQDPEPLPGEVPGPLASLTLRLLEKDPARRPQTARQVVEELEAIVESLS